MITRLTGKSKSVRMTVFPEHYSEIDAKNISLW